jgi:KEOPS complex subunit Cgi121
LYELTNPFCNRDKRVLTYIEEDQKYLKIAGFRGLTIRDSEEFMKSSFQKNPDIWVQFFDADLIATWEHLYFAVLNALLAYRNKRNISKTVAMETMIFASAQRQIRKAITILGVKESSSNVAVVIIGDKPEIVQTSFSEIEKCLAAVADESVLKLTKEKTRNLCKAFGITEKELKAVGAESNNEQAIVNLVIERMALMQTQL